MKSPTIYGFVFLSVLALVLFAMLTSCVCVDGIFHYKITAQLVTQDGAAVVDAGVEMEVIDGYSADPDVSGCDYLSISFSPRSDEDGMVEGEDYSGLSWGGCPPPDKAPKPETPKRVVMLIELSTEEEVCIEVEVLESHVIDRRSGNLDLNLGQVVVEN